MSSSVRLRRGPRNPKQKAKVEEAVEKLKYLAQLPFVKSVTLLSRKSMGTAFALPTHWPEELSL